MRRTGCQSRQQDAQLACNHRCSQANEDDLKGSQTTTKTLSYLATAATTTTTPSSSAWLLPGSSSSSSSHSLRAGLTTRRRRRRRVVEGEGITSRTPACNISLPSLASARRKSMGEPQPTTTTTSRLSLTRTILLTVLLIHLMLPSFGKCNLPWSINIVCLCRKTCVSMVYICIVFN